MLSFSSNLFFSFYHSRAGRLILTYSSRSTGTLESKRSTSVCLFILRSDGDGNGGRMHTGGSYPSFFFPFISLALLLLSRGDIMAGLRVGRGREVRRGGFNEVDDDDDGWQNMIRSRGLMFLLLSIVTLCVCTRRMVPFSASPCRHCACPMIDCGECRMSVYFVPCYTTAYRSEPPRVRDGRRDKRWSKSRNERPGAYRAQDFAFGDYKVPCRPPHLVNGSTRGYAHMIFHCVLISNARTHRLSREWLELCRSAMCTV